MQPMIAKIETYSCALMVLKALQLSGSRVSQALPTPFGFLMQRSCAQVLVQGPGVV